MSLNKNLAETQAEAEAAAAQLCAALPRKLCQTDKSVDGLEMEHRRRGGGEVMGEAAGYRPLLW